MPYLITTIPPGLLHAESDLSRADMPRRAVATLVEAQDAAWTIVADSPTGAARSLAKWRRGAANLPEFGGTVGPLPDGTVIEVELTTYADIAEAAGFDIHGYDGGTYEACLATINAFNAAQEVTR